MGRYGVTQFHPHGWTGGSYVVVRRFRMLLSKWESAGSSTRDSAVGRHIPSGAPLRAHKESDRST
ncbi:hypothetical protein [Streptomyces antimycoticus]|uniref:hypothetical protein n=1 Tax=Streptomyces antimycoticus TaxID=68175 RepID=UPI0036B68753